MFGFFKRKAPQTPLKKVRPVRVYKQLPEPKLIQLPIPAEGSGLEVLRQRKRIESLNRSFVNCRRQYIDFTSEAGVAVQPAWELIQVRRGVDCPIDWPQRWRAAGGKFYEGRMIACVDDPIWSKISDFGVPYPPFDQSDVWGIDCIARSECKRLGVDVPMTKLQLKLRKVGRNARTNVVSIKRVIE